MARMDDIINSANELFPYVPFDDIWNEDPWDHFFYVGKLTVENNRIAFYSKDISTNGEEIDVAPYGHEDVEYDDMTWMDPYLYGSKYGLVYIFVVEQHNHLLPSIPHNLLPQTPAKSNKQLHREPERQISKGTP